MSEDMSVEPSPTRTQDRIAQPLTMAGEGFLDTYFAVQRGFVGWRGEPSRRLRWGGFYADFFRKRGGPRIPQALLVEIAQQFAAEGWIRPADRAAGQSPTEHYGTARHPTQAALTEGAQDGAG